MKRLVEFSLEDGTTTLIEVDTMADGGPLRGIQAGEMAERVRQSFEDALDKIQPAAGAIVNKLRGLNNPPDQVSVEFGIKLSAAAGAFITSVASEANFKVTLNWKREVKSV